MVRLYVPPGEGQHPIIPKRPDSLGSIPEIQYSVVYSNLLAGAYALYARRYSSHWDPALTAKGLFIRSSAKIGLSFTLLGSAVSWWHHHNDSALVTQLTRQKLTPGKLLQKTERYTVDDGAFVGAGVGLIASFQRSPIPFWMRCVGLINIGALCGIVVSHGYLHYIGERQRAKSILRPQEKERGVQFRIIVSNKPLMARLEPARQAYVMTMAIYTRQPQDGFKRHNPEPSFPALQPFPDTPIDEINAKAKEIAGVMTVLRYRPIGEPDQLDVINLEQRQEELADLMRVRHERLGGAEYLLHEWSRKRYELYHMTHLDEDERQMRNRELRILGASIRLLYEEADKLNRNITFMKLDVQHKKAFDAGMDLASWTPPLQDKHLYNPKNYVPILALQAIEQLRTKLRKEVKAFEMSSDILQKDQGLAKNADDARAMLRAADCIHLELEAEAQRVSEEADSRRKQ
ncbi:hypothetical protein CC78DRAFT_617406 [Lojkania enalia]|uniref:Uncharacterized protein n=1 Tax=Lojkania enalia TaxID=147567 RepID=A0A9P4K717_9PLEO|nr:hypothetical protein CC78DRAFT_617406 [Didymosphaeria enalia]